MQADHWPVLHSPHCDKHNSHNAAAARTILQCVLGHCWINTQNGSRFEQWVGRSPVLTHSLTKVCASSMIMTSSSLQQDRDEQCMFQTRAASATWAPVSQPCLRVKAQAPDLMQCPHENRTLIHAAVRNKVGRAECRAMLPFSTRCGMLGPRCGMLGPRCGMLGPGDNHTISKVICSSDQSCC